MKKGTLRPPAETFRILLLAVQTVTVHISWEDQSILKNYYTVVFGDDRDRGGTYLKGMAPRLGMGLRAQEYAEIRRELDECKNPLFFHHDDPDGLCSFLLFYHYKKEGTGVVVKSQPCVNEQFLAKVREVQPDKIFIMDLALVSQEFIDEAKVPIIWIDHHEPQRMQGNVKYYNPRVHDPKDGVPASYLCYHVTNREQDLWLAMVGIVGDWHLTELAAEYSKKFPDLLPPTVTTPEQALFDTKIGLLAKIFSFVLKGSTKDVKKYIRLLTKIKDAYEILDQRDDAGTKIYKRYEEINRIYAELFARAQASVNESRIILFTYEENEYSMTGELSNELLYRHPDKLILIGRQKGGHMRCSLRSTNIILPPLVNESVRELGGHGGGHEHACGCSVPVEKFEEFVMLLTAKLDE